MSTVSCKSNSGPCSAAFQQAVCYVLQWLLTLPLKAHRLWSTGHGMAPSKDSFSRCVLIVTRIGICFLPASLYAHTHARTRTHRHICHLPYAHEITIAEALQRHNGGISIAEVL